MSDELWANIYLQRGYQIDSRKVSLYLITSSIGNICIVDYDTRDGEVKRKAFIDSYDKAESYFESIGRKIISDKL